LEAVAGLSKKEQIELFRMLKQVHQNLHIDKSTAGEAVKTAGGQR
jgi:hypothetical protein